MAAHHAGVAGERRRFLDRILSPFTVLQPGEGANAALLTLSVFLLLTSYYVLKVVREPLILAAGGATLKSYTSAAQAVLFLFLVPAYSALASRVNRTRLIATVTVFFIVNIVVFYVLAMANTPGLGIAFFIWVGIFNMMIVAQFWSYANDVYTPEQGKRLFAIIGFGQTMGAVFGGFLSRQLIKTLHVYQLMLVAAALGAAILARTAGHDRRNLRLMKPPLGGGARSAPRAAVPPSGWQGKLTDVCAAPRSQGISPGQHRSRKPAAWKDRSKWR